MSTAYKTKNNNGKKRPAHVVIMEQLIGRPLNPDEVVHHINEDKQDNRPENLQLMTRAEHTRLHRTGKRMPPDSVRKLRDINTGAAQESQRVLSPAQVRQICESLAAGEKGKDIASRFGVSPGTISDIRSGKKYADVVQSLPEELRPKSAFRKRTTLSLPPMTVQEIRILYEQGSSITSLAEKYGISRTSVKNIVTDRIYQDLPKPVKLGEALISHDFCELAGIFIDSQFPDDLDPQEILEKISEDREFAASMFAGELDSSTLVSAILRENYALMPTREAVLTYFIFLRALSGSREDIFLLYALAGRSDVLDAKVQQNHKELWSGLALPNV